MEQVLVIGTGGSISFEGRSRLDLFEYMDFGRRQGIEELLGNFPEVFEEAEIVPVDYGALSSSGIVPSDWLALNELLHRVVDQHPAAAGVVITHGTATLEETAFFLHLAAKVSVPVVLTGAQRPTNGLGSDAGMNVLGAVRVAGSRAARGMGVLTVLNDEIQSARDVTKSSTFRLQTFRSLDSGPLGFVDPDGRVVFYRRPFRRHAPDTEFDTRGITDLPRVDIAYCYGGADGAAIDAFVASGARAVVLAGVAPGMHTPLQREAIERALARRVLMVQASRAGGGRVIRRTVLREQGIVAADNLNPQKSRVLAMLALGACAEPPEPSAVQRMFDEY